MLSFCRWTIGAGGRPPRPVLLRKRGSSHTPRVLSPPPLPGVLSDLRLPSGTRPWRMVSEMHPEHPNATAYRATADAFRSGDREALVTLIDPDVVWHVPLVGDVRGRDRLIEWLGELLAKGFWLTEHDVRQ